MRHIVIAAEHFGKVLTKSEISGMKSNAVKTQTVWVKLGKTMGMSAAVVMSPKKDAECTTKVNVYVLTSDKIGILTLDMITKAYKNGGYFLRTAKDNIIALVEVVL
jgi:hypothetical protein